MRSILVACGAGAAVGGGILAAGGPRPDVACLAAIGAMPFFDVARRGFADLEHGIGDWTDLWMAGAFAAILIAAAWDLRERPPLALVHLVDPRVVTGLALIALGVALRVWAVRAMGRDFRVRLGVRVDQRLVQGGPFRAIRHPNYAGLGVVAIGTAVALGSPIALAAIVAVWLPTVLFRVAREERLLAGRFGEHWEAYRRRTARFIPGVY